MTYATPADVGVSDDYQDHLNRNSAEPGTDYKTAYGTDIRIAGDGVVALVDNSNQGPEGRRLQINMNNGEVIDYIHGANIRAYVGQPVEKGQRGVFITGASGYGDDWYYGPHVHVTRRLKKGLAFKDSVDFELALDKPTPKNKEEKEEEMCGNPRQIHTVENGKIVNRALIVPGTAYFLPWTESANAKNANGIAKNMETGDSTEVTQSLFDAFMKAAERLQPNDSLKIEIVNADK